MFLYLMAIGDAYGMKYEFVPHAQDKAADDLSYGSHPKFVDYPKGHYTDDTQMTLANVELLLRKPASGIEPVDFIESWLAAFNRDPHLGYSKYMYKVMTESADAEAFSKALDPSRPITSGAAMRAGAIGLLDNIDDVKMLTKMQAAITHNTPVGVTSAMAVALTVHFLHHGGLREDLLSFLDAHLEGDWRSLASEDPNNGMTITLQAMTAMLGATSLSDVLLKAVNNDAVSDTDTVCALAMVMASRCPELADDLPQALHDGLENGAYGAGYLKAIDDEIEKAFPVKALYNLTGPAVAKNPQLKF